MKLLMGPGPSNAAPEVLEALSRPLLGHLDPDFVQVMDEIAEMLRTTFRTSNRMTFPVSGTGSAGLEAALVNLIEPGDTAVICRNGVFGTRMVEVVTRAGGNAVPIDAEWGTAIEPSAVRDALEANPGAEVFAMVHAETSTGVAQPVEEIAEIVRGHGAAFVLDTVTSLAGMPVEIDAWGVDVAYSGTQKCLSVPPGLSPITYSDRGLERVRSRKVPVQSWYLDVTLLQAYWGTPEEGGRRTYHHTAPISMAFALHEGLRLVLEEGLEVRWKRHEHAASVLSDGLASRGFEYVAPEGKRLPMLHCVRLPGDADEAALRARLLTEHNIEVGAGLGPFAGKCWRIGLMGHNATEANVATLLDAIDQVL